MLLGGLGLFVEMRLDLDCLWRPGGRETGRPGEEHMLPRMFVYSLHDDV